MVVSRTKAALKALRETVGMTQRDLAGELGVDVRSVKRWESETSPNAAPDDAWRVLGEAREVQLQQITSILEFARERVALSEREPAAFTLTYYRDQAQYDTSGRADGPFGVANANARAAADALEREGFAIEFHYPERAAGGSVE